MSSLSPSEASRPLAQKADTVARVGMLPVCEVGMNPDLQDAIAKVRVAFARGRLTPAEFADANDAFEQILANVAEVARPALPAPEPPRGRAPEFPTDDEINDLIRRVLRNNDNPTVQREMVRIYLEELLREFAGAALPAEHAPPDVIEALKQADRALNNLIDEEGHRGESRLRKHPAPCNKLDFCVMNDSRQVQGRIRNALRILERGVRGSGVVPAAPPITTAMLTAALDDVFETTQWEGKGASIAPGLYAALKSYLGGVDQGGVAPAGPYLVEQCGDLWDVKRAPGPDNGYVFTSEVEAEANAVRDALNRVASLTAEQP